MFEKIFFASAKEVFQKILSTVSFTTHYTRTQHTHTHTHRRRRRRNTTTTNNGTENAFVRPSSRASCAKS